MPPLESLEARMNKYDELLVGLQVAQARTTTALEAIVQQNERFETRLEARQDKLEEAHLEVVKVLATLTQKQEDDVKLVDEKTASVLRYAAVVLSLLFIIAGIVTGILSTVIHHAFFH